MRRSLASHYRIKTAHHLLNIVALKREMDTYSVNGLLKAASTGHSKEACLRYAGLQAALLIEKRAFDDYAAMFKQGAAGGPAQPPRKPTQMSGFGAPNPIQLKPTAVPGLTTAVPGLSKGMQMDVSNGTSTGQRQRAIAAAGGGGAPIAPYVPGTPQSPGMLRDIANGTDTASRRGGIAMAGTNVGGGPAIGLRGPAAGTNPGGGMPVGVPAAKLSAGMIPKPTPTQGNANATSGLGYDPTGSGSAGRVSGRPPIPTKPENEMGSGSFKPTATSQSADEEAYMKSIEPTVPVSKLSPEPSPVAQEEVAAQSQGGRSGRFFNGQGIGQGLQNRGRIFGGRR